jgi:hypothetical protein
MSLCGAVYFVMFNEVKVETKIMGETIFIGVHA